MAARIYYLVDQPFLDMIPKEMLWNAADTAIAALPQCQMNCVFLITYVSFVLVLVASLNRISYSAGPHDWDGHCTARIFSKEGSYRGGVHFFINRRLVPTYKKKTYTCHWSWKPFWTQRYRTKEIPKPKRKEIEEIKDI